MLASKGSVDSYRASVLVKDSGTLTSPTPRAFMSSSTQRWASATMREARLERE